MNELFSPGGLAAQVRVSVLENIVVLISNLLIQAKKGTSSVVPLANSSFVQSQLERSKLRF